MSSRHVEYVVPPPAGAPKDVPISSQFRSTWVTGSVLALKNRGHFERYLTFLPPADHDPIVFAIPQSWMPASLMVRHYEACEKLELPDEEILTLGADVTKRVHAASLALGRSIASATGLTPWTILERMDKLWGRVTIGGGVGVAKLGPKEARVEIYGFPVAHLRYNRVGTRGILHGSLAMLCQSIWVHEVRSMCTATSLGFRVQWA